MPIVQGAGASAEAGNNIIGQVKITNGTLVASLLQTGSEVALGVQVLDGAGAPITTFGGGIQYTEGDTDASITGTALLWEDTSDTLRPVSAAKPLPVAIISAIPAGTNNMGDVDVVSQVASSFDHGSNRDVDATAEQITTSSITAKFGVLVRAAPGNSGVVYIGNSDVTAGTTDATDGMPLQAGESVLVKVDNANKVYAIGSAANQIVYWLVV
jgi:hypothetical protein